MTSPSGAVADVTIVGGGIVGICCALSLIESGKTVRLIDRERPGQGASSGNAGVISPWSVVPQAMPGLWRNLPRWLLDPGGPVSVRPEHLWKLLPWGLRFLAEANEKTAKRKSEAMSLLTEPCIDLYRHHLKGTGQEALVRDSYYVNVYRDPKKANLDLLDYRLRTALGADIERIEADELRRLEPALSTEFKAAVLIKGQARALSPGRIGEVLCNKFAATGGEVICDEVRSVQMAAPDDWSVSCEQGNFQSHQVVLSAGAWSARLLAPLGIRLPLEGERGYHVMFPETGAGLTNSILDTDHKVVASSMLEGIRIAGMSEFAGLDMPANDRLFAVLRQVASRLIPELTSMRSTTWMGTRPSLPDGLPCIGEVPNLPGLHMAFGHSHYGLMMAPKTGKLIADLVSGRLPNSDLSAFSPKRFG